MADEAEEVGGGAAPAGGGALKKYGPLAAIVLLAQVVLAWVLIQVTVGDKMSVDGDTGEELIPETELRQGDEEEISQELPLHWGAEQLAKITANPAGTNSTRFAVISVELGLTATDEGGSITPKDLAADASLEMIVAKKGLIRAIIIEVIRSKTVDQLESEIIGDVKDEIKRKLNRQVFERIPWDDDDKKKITVSEVLFTEIIIQ